MANKKVYFFRVTLADENGNEQNFRELKPLLKEIIENNAVDQGSYYSLDLTVADEYTHIIWDIFDYTNSRLFGRLSKQQPSNSFVSRNYATLEKKDMNISDERRAGIEKYTYGSLDYETGIFSIVSSQSAPTEKVIANVFWKYNRHYMVQIVPIPNADAINMIYKGDRAEITRVEVEVPLPEAAFLENILGWNQKDVLDVLEGGALNMSLVVKPAQKWGKVTKDSDETQGLLDCILERLPTYKKARIKAKTRTLKMREYDLFEQYFSYPIEISEYHIVSRRRVYYTVDELAEIFRKQIVGTFEINKQLLRTIVGR